VQGCAGVHATLAPLERVTDELEALVTGAVAEPG
jgi:hypothetical protein